MEKGTNKYCPLNNFQTICGNGCAWYNIQTAECSILIVSKELSCMELDLENINEKTNLKTILLLK